jgi:hypothetical protein
MQRSKLTFNQKIQDWILSHKGVTISVLLGLIFILIRRTGQSGAIVILMETTLLVILFIGMMIFVYNLGYLTIMLAVDEGLNDEERILLKWIIRRAVFISVLWFVGVLVLLMIFPRDPFLLTSANCFLLAFLFYFIRKGEYPLTEGTYI